MVSKSLFVLFTAVCLLISGCGRSNTSDDDANKLRTEDESLLQFCTNFPDAQECSDLNSEANELGLEDYFGGGNDPFSDNAFNNSGMGCGCRSHEKPVFYRGVLRCEDEETYRQVTHSQVVMRYKRRPNGKERLWISINVANINLFSDNSSEDNRTGISNCTPDFGARCNLQRGHQDCRGIYNSHSRQAKCLPIEGTNYGYCDRD